MTIILYFERGDVMNVIQDELEAWSTNLCETHLPRWEELPDFDIYMDQLITLVERYLFFVKTNDETIITAAMVNNYVKLKLIPKPEKKRYNKIHLAYLIAITLLKQVLSISEVKEGIEYQANLSGLKEAFNLFCDELEHALHATLVQIQPDVKQALILPPMSYENMAIRLASYAFASKLVAEKVVHLQNTLGGTKDE